jgi:hypothetical protein
MGKQLETVEQVAAAILAGECFYTFGVPRKRGVAGCRIAINLEYHYLTDAHGHRYVSHLKGYSALYFSRHGYAEVGDGKACGGEGRVYPTREALAPELAAMILAAARRAKGTITVRRN